MTSSAHSRSARLFASIIDHPIFGVTLLVVISMLAVGGYYRPTWPKEVYRLVFPKLEEKQDDPGNSIGNSGVARMRRGGRANRVARSALGRAEAFVVVQSKQIFTREGSVAIRRVVQALEELDTVESVTWLDQTPPINIFGLAEPILPKGNATEQRFAASKKKAVQHPLVVGQLLSPDAETLLLMINYDWLAIREDSDCTTGLLNAANRAIAEFPGVEMEFSVTGPVPIRLMLINNQEANQLKYQVIGYTMIVIMSIILFRGLSVVLVVALAPTLGVFWTFGLVRYFGLEDNPFSDVILPVLLALVGFADGVHMMVYIRRTLHEGLEPRAACKKSLEAVGMACFLTTVTTAIGMGSLMWANHQVVREFGMSCVFGVCMTFISVMFVIPLICCTRWSRRLARGAERGFVDQHLSSFSWMIAQSVKHSKLVSYLSIGLMVVFSCIALTLKPDDRKASSLPMGSPEQRALAHLDRAMGGLDICRVSIEWSPAQPSQEEIAQTIMEVDALLAKEPLIGHPLSLCRLLAALPGEESPVEKMSMAELLPPPLKLALYSPEEQTATVTFRAQDLGTMAYEAPFERIEAGFVEISKRHPSFRLSMSGEPIWRWHNLYQIVLDLARSLGSASVEIFIVLGIVYRSVRIGLISIIPNLAPLVAGATWMVFTGQPLEIVSVCAFTICLGIAVDDTIHFMSRYQEESQLESDHRLVIERAFHGVGTGMIMATLVLVAGFASVLFSETRDHRVFATLGIVTLISALFCDLLMLPALLMEFGRKRRIREGKASEAPPPLN